MSRMSYALRSPPSRKARLFSGRKSPVRSPLLSLDGGRMQQVLDNLLSNAVKFTPSGGLVRVMALLDNKVGRQRWVEVRVSDTGAGIPVEEVDRIFDKFYQSQPHRRERERGTGL